MLSYQNRIIWEKKREKEELKKIIDNENLSTDELWKLHPNNFTKWRAKYHLPILIDNLEKYIPEFKEWRSEFLIWKSHILKVGELTTFVQPVYPGEKERMKYLNRTNGKLRVIFEELNGMKIHDEKEYNYLSLGKFLPFEEWMRQRNPDFNLIDKLKYSYAQTSVDFLKDVNHLLLPNLEGKNFRHSGHFIEFANISDVNMSGKYIIGESGSPVFHYCILNNFQEKKLDLPSPRFFNCRIKDLYLRRSPFNSWRFVDSHVSGIIESCTAKSLFIRGGIFEPILKDSYINYVKVDEVKFPNQKLKNTFRIFKNQFHIQGMDKEANYFYLQEIEEERCNTSFRYNFIKRIKLEISKYYWFHGSKPNYIIYHSICIIILFSLMYFITGRSTNYFGIAMFPNPSDCLFVSISSFSTLGYFQNEYDIFPRILLGIEALLGIINFGFLVAGYSRSKY